MKKGCETVYDQRTKVSTELKMEVVACGRCDRELPLVMTKIIVAFVCWGAPQLSPLEFIVINPDWTTTFCFWPLTHPALVLMMPGKDKLRCLIVLRFLKLTFIWSMLLYTWFLQFSGVHEILFCKQQSWRSVKLCLQKFRKKQANSTSFYSGVKGILTHLVKTLSGYLNITSRLKPWIFSRRLRLERTIRAASVCPKQIEHCSFWDCHSLTTSSTRIVPPHQKNGVTISQHSNIMNCFLYTADAT